MLAARLAGCTAATTTTEPRKGGGTDRPVVEQDSYFCFWRNPALGEPPSEARHSPLTEGILWGAVFDCSDPAALSFSTWRHPAAHECVRCCMMRAFAAANIALHVNEIASVMIN
jgi:hypothetical protein